MGAVMSWMLRLFWSQEMELAVLGLQNAGKSTFVEVLNSGKFEENLLPTIGFNMSKVQKGRVTIKVWDMGGQEKFRSMWERYCRGVNMVVFVLDSADPKAFPTAKKELHDLLNQPSLQNVPLLLLFNKNDVSSAALPDEIIRAIDLDAITDRECAYYSTSCKKMTNIDKVLDWIVKHANKPSS